jgi:L-asparaginase II
MDPISVAVRRGPFVESVHLVHAVAVRDGEVVAEAGDRKLITSLRSSAKPFQALPLVCARNDLDDADIAIASASHRAEPEQIEAVRRLLAKAPATEQDLEVGVQEGRPPQPIYHNCSGKHAGFLAVCIARGWPTKGYRFADHPMQQLLHEEVAGAADLRPEDIPTAVDGCGVLTFALTLERMASSFSRFASLPGGDRIVAAMAAHPGLIGYEQGATDTDLMRLRPGWIAKGGAEGLICAASPDGVGVALKAEDGAMRGLRPALAKFLDLGEDFGAVPVTNMRGETVGEVAVG